jgi:hypothetical protein
VTDDRIRELRLGGHSERRIAAELGITRHRVRTVLEGFRPPAPIRGDTWVEEVELMFKRAKLRSGDDEQFVLYNIAFDTAEWLDANEGDERRDARQLAVALRYVVEGVVGGSNPLVRLHARRARRRLARLEGRDPSAEPIEPEIMDATSHSAGTRRGSPGLSRGEGRT